MEPVAGQKADMASFVTMRAVTDRKSFHHTLLELEACRDALAFIGKLHHHTASLQKPVMRLAMLHHILGLDDRYNHSSVVDVLATALKAVSDAVTRGRSKSKETLCPEEALEAASLCLESNLR